MSNAIKKNSAITAEIVRLHHDEQFKNNWNESGINAFIVLNFF